MEAKLINLERLKVNEINPRQITDEKFESLVKSIIILPKMLEIRPIAVDAEMVALGGNMRLQALNHIHTLDIDEIRAIIDNADTKGKTSTEIEQLIEYWQGWLNNPKVPIVDASNLSEAEQKEFIIKDNLGYGKWDWDKLANEWDEDLLVDWGFDQTFFGNDPDMDSLFDDAMDNTKEKDLVISIHLSGEDKDHYEDIKAIVEQTLEQYTNIKVR